MRHQTLFGTYVFFLYLLSFFAVSAMSWGQDLSFPDHSHRKKVIVIDPGHGGHDNGAVDPRGHEEKNRTLAIAKKIKDVLAPRFSVWLTRQGDYWIDVEKRTALANSYAADILISLHVSGGFDHNPQGIAVFCFGAGTSSRPFLKREDNVAGTDSPLQIWDVIQSRHQPKSKALCDLLHKNLLAKLELPDRGVHKAPVLILRGADMPAVLVEVGYMTHSAGKQGLDETQIVHEVADTISETILFFLETNG